MDINKTKILWSKLPTDLQNIVRDFDGYFKEIYSKVLTELLQKTLQEVNYDKSFKRAIKALFTAYCVNSSMTYLS